MPGSTVTRSQLDQIINDYYISQGRDPKTVTQAEKDDLFLNRSFTVVPDAQVFPSGQTAQAETIADKRTKLNEYDKAQEDAKANGEEMPSPSEFKPPKRDADQGFFTEIASAFGFVDDAQVNLPVEQGLPTNPMAKQVSSKDAIPHEEITPTSSNLDVLVDTAYQQGVLGSLDGYYIEKDADYAKQKPIERQPYLFERYKELSDTASGKGKTIAIEDWEKNNQSFLDAEGVLGKQRTRSTVPDLNNGQMAALKAGRAKAIETAFDYYKDFLPEDEAKTNAENYVNERYGAYEWWMNPELKAPTLALPNTQNTFLGLGTTVSPAGAQEETTFSYVTRMLSGPSNAFAGLVAGAVENVFPAYAAQRRDSKVTPINAGTSLSSSAGGNVAANRGFADELYDFTDAYTPDNELGKWLRRGAYTAGFGLDILTPIIPGSGLVKGAVRGIDTVGDLGKAAKLTSLEKAAVVGTEALSEIPILGRAIPLIDVEAKAIDNTTDAVVAERLTRGVPSAEKLPLLNTHLPDGAYKEAALKAANNGQLDDFLKATKPADELITATKADDLFSPASRSNDIAQMQSDTINATRKLLVKDSALASAIWKTKPKNTSDVIFAIKNNPTARAKLLRELAENVVTDSLLSNKVRSNTIALTENTAIALKDKDKILKAAAQTPVSKALESVISSPPFEAVKTSRTVGDAISGPATTSKINLTKKAVDVISNYLQFFPRTRENHLLDKIVGEVRSGTISTNTARKLIEMQIDDVARGVELKRMSPKDQSLITQPLEIREGFVYRKLKELASPVLKVNNQFLSVPAQTAIGRIQQEISGLDKMFKVKHSQLMDNEDVWKLYGFTKQPTKEEAFWALALKHPAKLSPGGMSNYLSDNQLAKLITDLSVYTGDTSKGVSWTARFKPVHLAAELPLRAKNILKPYEASFARQLELTSDVNERAQLVKQYLDVLNKALKDSAVNVIPSKNVDELLAGIFFKTEANKITNYYTSKIIDETAPAINKATVSRLYQIYRDVVAAPNTLAQFENELLTASANGKMASLTGDAYDTPAWLKDIFLKADYADYKAIDDLTNEIINLNGMVTATMAELVTDINRALEIKGKPILDNELVVAARKEYNQADTGIEKIRQLRSALDSLDDPEAAFSHLMKTTNPDIITDYQRLILEQTAIGKLIQDSIGSSFDMKKLTDALSELADKGRWTELGYISRAWKETKALAASAYSKTRALQYALMLTFRLRFHGVNWLTAPFIMSTQLGGAATIESLKQYNKGLVLANYLVKERGSLLDIKARNQIAIKDPAGRIYTWRDLSDIALQNGVTKSQFTFDLSKGLLTDAVKLAKDQPWVKNLSPAQWRDWINEYAEASDLSFRLGVLMSSLEKGDDVSTASAKAREALYDYGKMTDYEKEYISKWFMFWSFTRASSMSIIENLLSNPTRIKNQTLLTKGLNVFGDDDKQERRSLFYDDMVGSKVPIGMYKGIDKERYRLYGPSIPTVDAIMFLAKIASLASNVTTGDEATLSEELTGRSNPLLRQFVPNQMYDVYKAGYIDPRQVAIIKAAGLWDVFTSIIGMPEQKLARSGEIAFPKKALKEPATESTNQDGTVSKEPVSQEPVPVEAITYYYDDPDSAKRYLNLQRLIDILGARTMINDYIPLVSPIKEETIPLTSGDYPIELRTNIPEQLGIVSEIRYNDEVPQYNAERRASELKKQNK